MNTALDQLKTWYENDRFREAHIFGPNSYEPGGWTVTLANVDISKKSNWITEDHRKCAKVIAIEGHVHASQYQEAENVVFGEEGCTLDNLVLLALERAELLNI